MEIEDCNIEKHNFSFYSKLGFSEAQVTLSTATKYGRLTDVHDRVTILMAHEDMSWKKPLAVGSWAAIQEGDTAIGAVVVTDVAGTVAYDGRGVGARWDVTVSVAAGATLSWHGEPLVVSDGAESAQIAAAIALRSGHV